MTKSPTGIIPQEFNAPKHVQQVIEFLRALNVPLQDRQELLFGWARNVGVRLRQSQYEQLID